MYNNPRKTQALWYIINSKAVRQTMIAVSFNAGVIERMNRCRMLTYKMQVESAKVRCKKGLSALKAVPAKGIARRRLSLLY